MASTTTAAGLELVFTRVFDAPRGVVFEAWTNPKHLVNWWGPFGFKTTIQQMDVRPGGEWRLVMRGPDGRDYRNHIVFMEVARPSRLVFKHDPEPDSEPVSHQTTVTFEDEGERTRITMRLLFPSAEQREFVVKTYGADEGGRQTLQRLADHLLEQARKDVILSRVLNAPRELVWKIWMDPKHVAQWWGPHGFTNVVYEWDPQAGGGIRIEMHGADGSVLPLKGVFVEITPPERISFRASIPDSGGDVKVEIANTITFIEQPDGKTSVTLEARIVSTTEAGLVNLAGMEMGWTQSFERMAAEVEALCK